MNDKIKELLKNAEQSDSIAINKWRIENREQLREQRKKELKELMEKDKTMSNNKQSAVEYLVEQLFPKVLSAEQYYHIQQAKAMHKEEMMDFAFQVGRGQDYDDEEVRELAKIVYNETFGGNK